MKTESICKWCKCKFYILNKPKGWMANHSRWCNNNPKREQYVKKLLMLDSIKLMFDARKASGRTNQFSAAKLDGRSIPDSYLKGKESTFKGKTHTSETKKLMSEKALKSKHRRLQKHTVRYNGILLDSSWELELAKRLDELNIYWIRPLPIKWTDLNGTEHNYFPDFYLPNHNIYLDPKNPAAYAVQVEKIEILKKMYKNIIFIKTLKECKEFNI